jgi:tetratricopeptide (TPR) repeat protein
MSPWALWLCIILLSGTGMAVDVPFVFDETSSGVAGYTANQFENISTSSSDLAGIPQATTPSNNEILEFPVTGGGSAPGEKTETKVEELNRTINSNVEPNDDTVYRVAHQLAAEHPGDFTIDQVDEIYSHLKYGNDSMRAWSYSRDTRGVDKFNSASESLNLGHQAKSKCVGSGDCDDFAILIASLVESIGGTTRVIFARNNSTGGHAYSEVYLGRLNDPNGYVEEIINWLKQNYDTDKIFTHIDTDTKDAWLNLDWGPDDKGNMRPGGPFFQGDKHYIICIRNKFVKTPMNVPEKDNKPPKLISLTPDKNSPQNFGVIITWTAEAKDPEKDPIQYRFFRNDEPETKWQEENIWTWTTTDYDIGENQIEVQIRDGKHAGPDSFDSNKPTSFTITAPETKSIASATVVKPSQVPCDYPLIETGRYEEALECYNESIERDPNWPDGWDWKGVVLSDLRRYDDALICFDQAIKISPNFGMVWGHKGDVLTRLKRYNEAIKCFDKAIELGANMHPLLLGWVWYNKGNALKNIGSETDADIAFAESKKLGYTNEWGKHNPYLINTDADFRFSTENTTEPI